MPVHGRGFVHADPYGIPAAPMRGGWPDMAGRAIEPAPLPPGTLGRTYKRPSHPIPGDKHPRIGMVNVCGVSADAGVCIHDMTGYRAANGVWQFESEKPLLPGVPHIYTVRIKRYDASGELCSDYRVIRLIPGRVVTLPF